MTEQPSLFDDAPPADAPWWVTNPATMLDRQRAKAWHGEHPLSGVASAGHLTVHPDQSLTCGGCVFFERQRAQGEGVWSEPKCTYGATRDETGRITAAPRYLVPQPGQWYLAVMDRLDSDLVEDFPACKSWEAA